MSSSNLSYKKTSKKPAGCQARNRSIARVWCLARDLGLDGSNKEMLYVVIESVTGRTSISDLETEEIRDVIRHLTGLLAKQNSEEYRKNARSRKGGIVFLPTKEQHGMIEDLMKKLTPILNLHDPEGFRDSICRRTFRKPYSQLTRNQAKSLIEALKSIYNRYL
jgi:hypothetical protein